ncbi:hypothetical protein CKM354_000833500 [Cercospora kikuchii]|uniref:Chromo domain-containing protein n=1 Tax=Cercospora kikuchii TaxID=84275 RepID=A0A9P3CLS8_9PEZI|nr:uncharacterized protein CKM354_000833500 [Cercospora kikuchii]GIZ45154.1 hypothetical protein CKM354_000833500 [Cercospora kikuchii]
MPPSLDATLYRERTPVFKHPPLQKRVVLGSGVISRSPERGTNAKSRNALKPRSYGDGPLPFKPSETAPRDARIVGRVAEPGKLPMFTVKVGDVEIEDITLHEILEYVSPYELERFENEQFAEEREALAAALAAAETEEERRRQRRKEKARRKGIVLFEEVNDEELDSADANEVVGRHGRARPTYKHLFKAPQERRRRRKRDPETGELLPLSDEDDQMDTGVAMDSSDNDQDLPSSGNRESAYLGGELPKRRRRKRDPVTGELLPLPPLPHELGQSPEASVASVQKVGLLATLDPNKRPRRRRHPITRELMPLGWRYDPETDPMARKAAGSSPSIRRLSISQEQQPKRVKLASESSADDHPRAANTTRNSPHQASPRGTSRQQQKPTVIDLSETDDLHDEKEEQSKAISAPSPGVTRSTPRTSMLHPTAHTASSGSSGERVTLASFLKASATLADESDTDDSELFKQKPAVRNTATHGKTSILNPIASKQAVHPAEDEAADNDESDLDDGEWFVEAIVGHKMSDPRSHPGRPSIMLYKTKWEGHDEPTWKPADSFVDQNTVTEYRARAGLDNPKQVIKSPGRIVPVVASSSRSFTGPSLAQGSKLQGSNSASASSNGGSEGDEDEDGYEIETILAHHMSDPRTHPGKPQTMLYKVKWVGYPATAATWEPKGSFPNLDIVNAYRRKVGLKPETR